MSSPNPDMSPPNPDENLNPTTGRVAESKSQKRKRQQKEITEALKKSQQNEALQRQTIREQALQIEQLKVHAEEEGNSSSSDSKKPSKKKKPNTSSGSDTLCKDVLQAGKRFAVCELLWPDPAAIRYVALHHRGSQSAESESHEASESESESDLKEQAAKIYRSLPVHLRPYVKENWFRTRFKEGAKSIRSSQVHSLAKLFPTYVFPELPAEFSDKAKRRHLPEVASLLSNKRFMYDRDPTSPKAALAGHLRHPCILKTLQCLLHGPCAVMNGTKSPKARNTNAKLWGCTKVTIAMLACAATIVFFILSGEGEFAEQGIDYDFLQFYETRISILEKEAEKNPKRHQKLLDYFNAALFPDEDTMQDKNVIDEEEAQLLKAISDGDISEAETESNEREVGPTAAESSGSNIME